MSKPFNIHDWQAKQRLNEVQQLNELDPLTTAAGMAAFLATAGIVLEPGALKDVWNFIRQKDTNKDSDIKVTDVPMNEASEVGPTIADQIFELFDHKIGEWTISPDYRVTQETQKYLEAWKEEAKSRINLILGDVNEASMTGTGASITTGDSMAYATPNAFKKKNKED